MIASIITSLQVNLSRLQVTSTAVLVVASIFVILVSYCVTHHLFFKQNKNDVVDVDVDVKRTHPNDDHTIKNINGDSNGENYTIDEDGRIKRKKEFLQSNHGRMGYGYESSKRGHIDTWRSREFPRLIPPIRLQSEKNDDNYPNDSNHNENQQQQQQNENEDEKEIYLDYAGSSLPSRTLLNDIHNMSLQYQILANPHSSGIAASRSMEMIEKVKMKLLDFFNAREAGPMYHDLLTSGDDNRNYHDVSQKCENNNENSSTDQSSNYHPGYDIIFTSGATESLRIIGEHFQWTGCKQDTQRCHSSTSSRGSNTTSSSSIGNSISSSNSGSNINNHDNDEFDSNHRQQQYERRAEEEEEESDSSCSSVCNDSFQNDNDDFNISNNRQKSILVYPQNAHTSVIGMRECALAKGATFRCEKMSTISNANEKTFQQWIAAQMDHNNSCTTTHNNIQQENYCKEQQQQRINHLLVLPLECNFDGTRLMNAKSVIETSRNYGRSCRETNDNGNDENELSSTFHKWYTMLDIAKAACTQKINLRELDPDFACVSFYKIFGRPTGIGALFVKRSSKHVILPDSNESYTLQGNRIHRYFGGGAVDIVLPRTDFVSPRSNVSSLSSFTHGTINFHGISSLLPCLDEIDSIGGMAQIYSHTKSLVVEAVKRLKELHHGNGKEAIILYGSWSDYNITNFSPTAFHHLSGPTIAFNIVRQDGSFVGYNEVSKLASLFKHPIQLRTGCFCNPGACQDALQLDDDQIKENYLKGGHVCGDDIDIMNGKPTGAVRLSFGKESIWEDLDSFIIFLKKTFVARTESNFDRQKQKVQFLQQEPETEVTLSEIYVYPIKSCSGTESILFI